MESDQTVVIARTARWKAVLLLAPCLLFTGAVIFGLSTGQQADGAPLSPIAWVAVPLLAAVGAFGSFIALRMILRPKVVRVSPEGLSVSGWRNQIEWDEVEAFSVNSSGAQTAAIIRFRKPIRSTGQNPSDFEGTLPNLLNISPVKLVNILEDWRLRYG